MIPAETPPGLDQLRNLHLPVETGLLRGEILAAAALGLLAALLVGLVRHLRRRVPATVRRAALHELALTHRLEPGERLVAQARLLRRLARTLRGDDARHAEGAGWAAELDALLGTDFFTRGAGRVLADGLYRRHAPDLDAIEAELGRLIGRVRT